MNVRKTLCTSNDKNCCKNTWIFTIQSTFLPLKQYQHCSPCHWSLLIQLSLFFLFKIYSTPSLLLHFCQDVLLFHMTSFSVIWNVNQSEIRNYSVIFKMKVQIEQLFSHQMLIDILARKPRKDFQNQPLWFRGTASVSSGVAAQNAWHLHKAFLTKLNLTLC